MPDAACLTCNELAPILGESGYLGYPTLDQGPAPQDLGEGFEDLPSFGEFYRAFASLHLVSSDLTRYRDFLTKHRGHKMYLSLDDEDVATLPDVFVADREGTAVSKRPDSGTSGAPGHVQGHVVYTCAECDDSRRTPEADSLLPFEPVMLDAAAAGAASRLLSSPEIEGGWTHGLCGVLDPFGELFYGEQDLRAFLDEHLEHGIEAVFEPA